MDPLIPGPVEKYSPRELLPFARNRLYETLLQQTDEKEAREVTDKAFAQERRLLHKRFEMPQGFPPYDMFARCAAISMYYVLAGLGEQRRDKDMGGQTHLFETFKDWVGFKQPLICCTRELGQALLNTDPPETLTYQDITWPYHVWTVALPPGLIHTISGTSVTYVMVKIVNAADRADREATAAERDLLATGLYEDGRGQNLLEVVICSDVEVYWRSMRPQASQPLKEFMNLPETARSGIWGGHTLNDTEEEIVERVIYFVTSLAMFLSGEPDDVLAERLIKTIKAPKGVRSLGVPVGRDELWSPHVAGRRYTDGLTVDERNAHDRRTARTHWRRGHWRAQRHGQGLALVKVLWIKPTLVNTGEE